MRRYRVHYDVIVMEDSARISNQIPLLFVGVIVYPCSNRNTGLQSTMRGPWHLDQSPAPGKTIEAYM